jgi:predicted transcriptional regulator
MTRTAIRDLFKRNRSGTAIYAALETLAGLGYVNRRQVTDTGGRPAEIWVAK